MAVETLAIQQIGAGFSLQDGTPREVEDAHYETVQASGYWYPEKQPGDRFPQGELLGRVERTLQAITAPVPFPPK